MTLGTGTLVWLVLDGTAFEGGQMLGLFATKAEARAFADSLGPEWNAEVERWHVGKTVYDEPEYVPLSSDDFERVVSDLDGAG